MVFFEIFEKHGQEEIIQYRTLYVNLQDPVVFIPVTVYTSGRVCGDILCVIVVFS